jgi:hypothetical protein
MSWVIFVLIFLAGGGAGIVLMCLFFVSKETSAPRPRRQAHLAPPMAVARSDDLSRASGNLSLPNIFTS